MRWKMHNLEAIMGDRLSAKVAVEYGQNWSMVRGRAFSVFEILFWKRDFVRFLFFGSQKLKGCIF